MRVRWLSLPAAVVAALAAAACADPTTSPPAVERPTGPAPRGPLFDAVSSGAYLEDFSYLFGVAGPLTSNWPAHDPAPWQPRDFDVAIHMRDRAVWDAPQAFQGMHGT